MRLWQVDLARGISVVFMVLFNWSFSLLFLGVVTLTDSWLYWWLFPRLIGATFIFLAGISMYLSFERVKSKTQSFVLSKYLKRGGMLLGLGLGITVLTYLLFPREAILFGILHLIGASIFIGIPFLWSRRTSLALPAGFFAIIAGSLLQVPRFDFPWLIWLGFAPVGFITLDYFPLFPWVGFFLLGLFFGSHFKKIKASPSPYKLFRPFLWLGRHSLLVYLVHQPILVSVLLLTGKASLF